MSIQINLDGCAIKEEDREIHRPDAARVLQSLWNGEHPYTGWIRQPLEMSDEEFATIEEAAEEIRNTSECFVVLGVGGSYIGARAMTDGVHTEDGIKKKKCRHDPAFF